MCKIQRQLCSSRYQELFEEANRLMIVNNIKH